MPGLRETIAALASSRTAFDAATRDAGRAPQGTSAVPLKDVTGFGDNPGALRMLVYAPQRLAARPALVVVLHGCTQTASAYAQGAGWLTLAERYGFVVLAPEQTRSNNANLCFNWFEPHDVARGAGETASIRAMVGRATADHGVDPARVFVTGLSAGGAMAGAMLATYPEVFAGGGIVAGLPFGAAAGVQEAFSVMCGTRRLSPAALGAAVRAAAPSPRSLPRVQVWQGGADTTVRPACGEDVAAQWAAAHGAAAGSDDGARATWRGASGETVVELRRVPGMGHGAPVDPRGPEGAGAAGPFLLDVGVSSSSEMLRFWGLSGAAEPVSGRATPPVEPLHPPRDTVPLAVTEVGEVISTALRKAGLLR